MPRKLVEIDCEEVWRQISNYLEKDLDSGLRAIMEAHFKDCAHCSAIFDGTRNVVKLVADGKAFELPESVSQRFYLKLNRYLESQQPKKHK